MFGKFGLVDDLLCSFDYTEEGHVSSHGRTNSPLDLPSLLWSLYLPMVQLFANHDFRSDTSWPWISLLQSIQHCREDIIIYWTNRLQRYHWRHPFQKPINTLLLPICIESVELRDLSRRRRSEEEPSGAGAVLRREKAKIGGKYYIRTVAWMVHKSVIKTKNFSSINLSTGTCSTQERWWLLKKVFWCGWLMVIEMVLCPLNLIMRSWS